MRELLERRFQCFESAFELTKYLRGELYIFVDLVMTSEHQAEHLDAIYVFLEDVVRVVALWLKTFPSCMLGSYVESRSYYNLYGIDRNVALALCGYELMDMLSWLFCVCTRTGFFFAVKLCLTAVALRHRDKGWPTALH